MRTMAVSAVGSGNSIFDVLPQLQQRQSVLFNQLSSGNRLVSAAVDAAGLAVSQELTSQVNGLGQAQDNANMANDLFQTAGSAVSTQQGMLQQENQLSLEAANDTLTSQDRQIIQGQIDQLNQGLNDVAQQTQFNTQPLLNGQFNGTFQVGANAGQTIQSGLNGTGPNDLGVANLDVTTQSGAENAISQIAQGIQTTNAEQGAIGATENQLTNASNNAGTAQVNAASALSLVSDTNVAQASTDLANSLLQQQFSLFAMQQQASTFALQGSLIPQ